MKETSLLTKDVYESVSDPGVHPAVDDRVEAGVGQSEQVHCGKDVGKTPVVQNGRLCQSKNLKLKEKD